MRAFTSAANARASSGSSGHVDRSTCSVPAGVDSSRMSASRSVRCSRTARGTAPSASGRASVRRLRRRECIARRAFFHRSPVAPVADASVFSSQLTGNQDRRWSACDVQQGARAHQRTNTRRSRPTIRRPERIRTAERFERSDYRTTERPEPTSTLLSIRSFRGCDRHQEPRHANKRE